MVQCALATKGLQYVNDIPNENDDFPVTTKLAKSLALDGTFYMLYNSDKVCHLSCNGDTDRACGEPFIHYNDTLLQLDKCTTRSINGYYVQIIYVIPTNVLEWKTLHKDFDMSN